MKPLRGYKKRSSYVQRKCRPAQSAIAPPSKVNCPDGKCAVYVRSKIYFNEIAHRDQVKRIFQTWIVLTFLFSPSASALKLIAELSI